MIMDWFTRVVQWNKERNLLALGFDHQKEVSFIVEELLESTGKHDSLSARAYAETLAKDIVGDSHSTPEQQVDALADIIVFATGAIAKAGYDPTKVMEEVYQEIHSRTGKLVDGKFVKDPDAVPYKADFTDCKL
jgi:predicted HAD superfamily Cof-like phosphohydrolase